MTNGGDVFQRLYARSSLATSNGPWKQEHENENDATVWMVDVVCIVDGLLVVAQDGRKQEGKWLVTSFIVRSSTVTNKQLQTRKFSL